MAYFVSDPSFVIPAHGENGIFVRTLAKARWGGHNNLAFHQSNPPDPEASPDHGFSRHVLETLDRNHRWQELAEDLAREPKLSIRPTAPKVGNGRVMVLKSELQKHQGVQGRGEGDFVTHNPRHFQQSWIAPHWTPDIPEVEEDEY